MGGAAQSDRVTGPDRARSLEQPVLRRRESSGGGMDIAGARRSAARIASALRRNRAASAKRDLVSHLTSAVRARPRPPADVPELCRALCQEMSARRGGRPVDLRFERFPDEIAVTGVWVEVQDVDRSEEHTCE